MAIVVFPDQPLMLGEKILKRGKNQHGEWALVCTGINHWRMRPDKHQRHLGPCTCLTPRQKSIQHLRTRLAEAEKNLERKRAEVHHIPVASYQAMFIGIMTSRVDTLREVLTLLETEA